MLPPAEIEPDRNEPPPHLRGALRAAAAARDRAERIRAVESPPAPASRPPPARPGPAAWSDPVAQSDPPSGQPADRTRFARTFAAAQQLRAAVAAEDADLPLHLRLREEDAAPRRAGRWWSRLLEPLSAPARPAPDRLSLPGPQAAAAADAQPAPRPAGATPAALGRPHPPAASLGAALERAAVAAGALPGAEAAPAACEVLQLPPLGRGELACDAPLSGPMDPPRAPPKVAGPDPQQSARPHRGGGRAAGAEARREAPPDPLYRPWLAHHAARASGQLAWAPQWRPSWPGTADTGLPAAQTARYLPVPYTGAGLPATRLADVLARPRGGPRRDRAGPARGARWSAPSAATAFTALRSRSRWLLLTGSVAAGFALGIVAYGSSPLSGTGWGQAMLALNAGWFERTRSDGAAPAALGAPSAIAEPPAAAPARPAAGGRVDLSAERRGATSSMDGAALTPAALPETRTAGAASAGFDPEAGGYAIARGPVDFDLSSRATAAPAAPQAAAAEWQSLYAEGHRFQLSGNLVAAADAYRRALRLNPEHPAIYYDLGYVLQMQGRAGAAIDHYRRAIALQPDHGYAHYNLGYLLQSLGEGAAALEHYGIAAARLPDNAFVYYDWAWSLELSGDPAGAAELYRKAIALDPEDRPGIDARRRLAALGRSARLE